MFLKTGGKFYFVGLPDENNQKLKFAWPHIVPGVVFTDILIARFCKEANFLLLSTDLGKLEYFQIDEDSGQLRRKKAIHVGVRPLKYQKVMVKGQLHVIVCSDQVSMMKYEGGGLTFCHLDVKNLNFIYSIDHDNDLLLYHSDGELCIGIIPEKQMKSFVSIHIGETIEKLVYNPLSNLIIAVASNEAVGFYVEKLF